MPDARDVLSRFIEEVYGEGRLEPIDDVVHEEYVDHTMMLPGVSPDREGVKRFVEMLHGALSDTNGTIERTLVDGDQVAWRWRMWGTHTGEFAGIPPSGNRIEITGNDVGVVRDGKLMERWCEQDMLSLMTQLGAIEPPVR